MQVLFNLIGITPGCTITPQGVPAILPGRIPLPPTKLLISGITKDGITLLPLDTCTVNLFRTQDNFCMETVISDANGLYSFSAIGLSETYYLTAYTAAGDLAGITVNTLLGA